jgi:2-octaprenyl-6-methoxyphenol hydroxylase
MHPVAKPFLGVVHLPPLPSAAGWRGSFAAVLEHALRDAAALAEVIADAARDGCVDVGSAAILERYRNWRSGDQRKLAGFTHGLVRGFGIDAFGVSAIRGAGLMAFDLIPGAKSLLARHTMGLAGRVPKLARHLDLAQ